MANVIITLLKDEDNFVVDFIVHHLGIGFDRIVMFDDLSHTPVQSWVKTLPEALQKKVECHRFSSDFYHWHEDKDSEFYEETLYKRFHRSKQMYILNWALTRLVDPRDWVALTDIDEFLWLGAFANISEYRQEIQNRGFSAAILTMLLYGHSFNIVPPKPSNICSFVFRSENYFGHGKFFAHVGAMTHVATPHLPAMRGPGLLCDRNFNLREKEHDWDRPKVPDFNQPHLKHYTVQDVYSCFRRRTRTRISAKEPLAPTTGDWVNRVNLLKTTSMEVDTQMAASVIDARARVGLDVETHARALAIALGGVQATMGFGPSIDFDFLRSSMGYDPSISEPEALYRYIHQDHPDVAMLRFERLPPDFDPEVYKSLHRDLRSFSNRKAEFHYFNYGKREGRIYKSQSS